MNLARNILTFFLFAAVFLPTARAIAIIPPVAYGLTISIGSLLASVSVMLVGAAAGAGLFRGELFGKKKSDLLDWAFRSVGKVAAGLLSIILAVSIITPLSFQDAAVAAAISAAVCFIVIFLASFREWELGDSPEKTRRIFSIAGFCLIVLVVSLAGTMVSIQKTPLFFSTAAGSSLPQNGATSGALSLPESMVADSQSQGVLQESQSKVSGSIQSGYAGPQASDAIYVIPESFDVCTIEFAGTTQSFQVRRACRTNPDDIFELSFCALRIQIPPELPDGNYSVQASGSCSGTANVFISAGKASLGD